MPDPKVTLLIPNYKTPDPAKLRLGLILPVYSGNLKSPILVENESENK